MTYTKSALLCALVALTGTVACATDHGDVGSVNVALVGSAGDGTQYRLPTGSLLTVRSGSYYEQVVIDGDDALLSLELPPGDYDVELVNPDQNVNVWMLDRLNNDGSVLPVAAELTTLMPAIVTIADTTTSELTLTFAVADAGEVTFDVGQLDVTVDVTETMATAYSLRLVAPFQIVSALYGPTAPAEVTSGLPDATAPNTYSLEVTMDFDANSWHVFGRDFVCSPSATLSDLNVGGPAMLQGLWLQLFSGNGQLCIQGGAEPAIIVILSYRDVPTEPSLMGLGADEVWIGNQLTVPLSTSVLANNTLDLPAMLGEHANAIDLNIGFEAIPTGGSQEVRYYSAQAAAANGSYQLIPWP